MGAAKKDLLTSSTIPMPIPRMAGGHDHHSYRSIAHVKQIPEEDVYDEPG